MNGTRALGRTSSKGGGTIATGVLQLANGVALDTTLRAVTDQANTASPLQLSTQQVAIRSFSGSSLTPRVVAQGTGFGVFDIIQFGSSAGEFAGYRIRRADGVIKWQLLNDDNDNFTIYSGSNKVFTVSSSMQNISAIGLNQPLDATLRAFTTGAATSPLQLSTTVVGIGRLGVDGLMHFINGGSGFVNTVLGQRAGFADFYLEGNNVNFRSNSTGFFFGGGSTWTDPTARLHVRGDGTNHIIRLENSANVAVNTVANSGLQTISCQTAGNFAVGSRITTAVGGGLQIGAYTAGNGAIWSDAVTAGVTNYALLASATSSSINGTTSSRLDVSGTQIVTATSNSIGFTPITLTGSSSTNGLAYTQTWNTTGSPTAFFMNITNFASGASANLMDLQVGGVSRFRVDRVGVFSCGNTVAVAAAIASTHKVTVVIGGVTYFLLASNI